MADEHERRELQRLGKGARVTGEIGGRVASLRVPLGLAVATLVEATTWYSAASASPTRRQAVAVLLKPCRSTITGALA